MSGIFDISTLPMPYLAIATSTPAVLVANMLWYNPDTNVWQLWDGSVWAELSFNGVPSSANEGDILVYQGGEWVATDVLTGGSP